MKALVLLSVCSCLPALATDADKAWTIINEGLAQEDPLKRRKALNALAMAATPPAIAKMETGLEDKNDGVRQTAVAMLGQIRSRRSIPKLKKALDDDAPEVAFTAAKVLWEMGDKSGKEILIGVLMGDRKDAPGGFSRKMGEAKETLRSPKKLAVIGLREGAGALLGPFSAGVGAVEELIKEGPAAGRVLSIGMLAKDPDWRSEAVIEAALEDKNDYVRAAAARALAERGNRAAIAKISPLLADKNPSVSYIAAASIIRLSGARPPAAPAGVTKSKPPAAQTPSQTQAAK